MISSVAAMFSLYDLHGEHPKVGRVLTILLMGWAASILLLLFDTCHRTCRRDMTVVVTTPIPEDSPKTLSSAPPSEPEVPQPQIAARGTDRLSNRLSNPLYGPIGNGYLAPPPHLAHLAQKEHALP